MTNQDIPLHIDERVILQGTLTIPRSARGLVIFAKGSEPNRKNALHRSVADKLNAQNIATLLLDTLMPVEAAMRSSYHADLHAERLGMVALIAARQWKLPIGFLGFGAGAASAMIATADLPSHVRALVTYNGRFEAAVGRAKHVQAPTLIVNTPYSLDAFAGRLVQRQAQSTDELCSVASAWFRQNFLQPAPIALTA